MEVEKSWLRHANEDAKEGEKDKGRGGADGGGRTGAGGASVLIPVSFLKKKITGRSRSKAPVWPTVEPVRSICCLRIRLGESFVCSCAVVRLVLWLFAFIFHGRVTTAALKSEAAVDGNRMDMADCMASLQARLGDRELENFVARASPLSYEYE